jgi:uncharacterized cupin superfamily protein
MRGRNYFRIRSLFSIGIWECTPGRWRRQVRAAELARFVAGRALFQPEHGKPIEIYPGKVVYFPPHTMGTWDVKETLRKIYVTIATTRELPARQKANSAEKGKTTQGWYQDRPGA